jgi:hypothetical protein
MKLTATLEHPLLVGAYGLALLLLGCAIGLHWQATRSKALILAGIGSALMVGHDLAMGVLWFWAAATMVAKTQQRRS